MQRGLYRLKTGLPPPSNPIKPTLVNSIIDFLFVTIFYCMYDICIMHNGTLCLLYALFKNSKKKLTAYLHSPNYMYLYADKTNRFVE